VYYFRHPNFGTGKDLTAVIDSDSDTDTRCYLPALSVWALNIFWKIIFPQIALPRPEARFGYYLYN